MTFGLSYQYVVQAVTCWVTVRKMMALYSPGHSNDLRTTLDHNINNSWKMIFSCSPATAANTDTNIAHISILTRNTAAITNASGSMFCYFHLAFESFISKSLLIGKEVLIVVMNTFLTYCIECTESSVSVIESVAFNVGSSLSGNCKCSSGTVCYFQFKVYGKAQAQSWWNEHVADGHLLNITS